MLVISPSVWSVGYLTGGWWYLDQPVLQTGDIPAISSTSPAPLQQGSNEVGGGPGVDVTNLQGGDCQVWPGLLGVSPPSPHTETQTRQTVRPRHQPLRCTHHRTWRRRTWRRVWGEGGGDGWTVDWTPPCSCPRHHGRLSPPRTARVHTQNLQWNNVFQGEGIWFLKQFYLIFLFVFLIFYILYNQFLIVQIQQQKWLIICFYSIMVNTTQQVKSAHCFLTVHSFAKILANVQNFKDANLL